MIDIFH